MTKLFIFTILSVAAFSLFSCTTQTQSAYNEQYVNVDSLYEKYKNMIGDTDNCIACVDCAAMALAISYEIDEEIAKNHEKLVKYYKEHGTVPCPELLNSTEKQGL